MAKGAAAELLEKFAILQKADPEGKLDITKRMHEMVKTLHQKMVEASGEYLHGDSIHDEEPEKVKNLLDIMPECLTVKNEHGELPDLLLAIKYGVKWSPELSGVINAQGHKLSKVDADSGMYPFSQAIVGGCELSVVFDLIRKNPEALVDQTKINDGESELILSAIRELNRGPADLPQNYHGYFEHTIMDLLTKTPKELRLWFAKVKLAREITGTDKPDQFSSDGALRQWVGLPNKQRIS